MPRIILSLCLLVFCHAISLRLAAQSIMGVGKVATPWELEKATNAIEGYTRIVEGQELKEFKVTTTTDLPFDKLVEALKDPNVYGKWQSKTMIQWQMLDTLEDGYRYYCIGKTPVFVEDRDFVFRSSYSMAGERFIVKISGVPDDYPVQEGIIRVDRIEMLWIATPVAGGKTEIVTIGMASPGGKIPVGMANKLMLMVPFENMEGLLKYVASLH